MEDYPRTLEEFEGRFVRTEPQSVWREYLPRETLRRWMLAAGLWSRRRKRQAHRQRRQRKTRRFAPRLAKDAVRKAARMPRSAGSLGAPIRGFACYKRQPTAPAVGDSELGPVVGKGLLRCGSMRLSGIAITRRRTAISTSIIWGNTMPNLPAKRGSDFPGYASAAAHLVSGDVVGDAASQNRRRVLWDCKAFWVWEGSTAPPGALLHKPQLRRADGGVCGH